MTAAINELDGILDVGTHIKGIANELANIHEPIIGKSFKNLPIIGWIVCKEEFI